MADGEPREARPTEGAGATSRLLKELLAQGRPVAEIAVRLGISVPDAHARISGAPPGRAAPDESGLPPSLPGEGPPETVAGTPPARPRGLAPATRQPRPPAPSRRGLSRRALLALTAAGVAGAATGGWFMATQETREAETVARPPRPVPVPPTLTPVPPPLAALQPATNVFEEVVLPPGTPVWEEHGIFFMETRGEGAGSVRGWQLTEPGNGEAPVYRASTGGRFVTAGNALQDRLSGRSWSWPEDRLRLVGFSDEAVLFEKIDPERKPFPVKVAQYVLADENLEERAVFELKGAQLPSTPPFFEPGGRRAFLALEQPQQYPALFLLDGSTGHATTILAPQRQRALQRILFHAPTPASDGDSFLFPFSYWPTRPPLTLGYGIFATFVARVGWTGDHRGVTRVRVDRAFVSPDGSLVAGERVLAIQGAAPDTFEETSTVLVMDGESGRIRFRIRSARLNYGDELGGLRWLADSSGLVVQSRIDGKVGYSLVSADGSSIEQLPDPPSASSAWFQHRDVRGAAPSPDDPSLFAFGRTDVYDRASDRWLGVQLTESDPSHVGPWGGSGSEETVLALPHRPHRVYPLLASLDETHIEQNVPMEGGGA